MIKQVWRTGASEHHPVSLYSDNRLSQWLENTVYKLASGEIVVIFTMFRSAREWRRKS